MNMQNLKTDAAQHFFPVTSDAVNLRPRRYAAARGHKYGSVAGYAVAETFLILPKLVLGTKAAGSPQDALRPGFLSRRERGLVGAIPSSREKSCKAAAAQSVL